VTGEPFEPSPIFAGAYTYCGMPFKNNTNIRLARVKHSSLFVWSINDPTKTNKLGCLSNICWRLYFQCLSRIFQISGYHGTNTLAYLSRASVILRRQISYTVCQYMQEITFSIPFKNIPNISLASEKYTGLFVHSIIDCPKTNKLGCLSNICRNLCLC
jgi:hypothetical protein